MRKIWSTCLLLGAMSMTFTNCSSDSNNEPGTNENKYDNPAEYVGKWELISANTLNTENDTLIKYNGDHVMIVKENGTAVNDINGFFYWRVDTENKKFEINYGTSYWLSTITTKSITADEWNFSEQIGFNQFIDSKYKKIKNAYPADMIGKWNIYKVLKKAPSQTTDTIDSEWIEAGQNVTITDGWYDKYVTFKDDGTYIDYDGRDYEWFVTGPHIWTVGTECTDMLRVYSGVDSDKISYVTKGDKENTRYYLKRAE